MRWMPQMIIAWALTALVASGCSGGGNDDAAEEEEVAEDAAPLLAGDELAPSRVAELLEAQGFPAKEIPRLVCTAKWESTFFVGAVNENRSKRTRRVLSVDRGLFQINSIHTKAPLAGCPSAEEGDTLFDPEVNVRCAHSVWKAQGINAWYGYRAHRNECDRYKVPAGG